MDCRPIPLTADAFRALDRAAVRDGHDWVEIAGWLEAGAAQVWQIGDGAFVLTFANSDDEIEVLLAGGADARSCVGPWERAMLALPAHKGKTLRIEGRPGWARLLPHWQNTNGVLTLKVE